MTSHIGLLLAFFAFVMGAITLAGYVFVLRPSRAGERGETPLTALTHPDLPTAHAFFVQMFRLMGEAIPGARDQANPLRQKLVAAGYRWPSAISIIYGIKCASALLVAVLGGWAAATFRQEPLETVLPIVCGIGFGYLVPDRILDRLARARQGRLRRGLPAALDLLVLGIEAGQGLDAAILETSRGLKNTHADLAAEFTQLQLELRANTSRADALRNFAERNKDLELRKFTNLLLDTDRFGTQLAPALRTHAKYMRIRFRQQSQERARKIGVKLIFPVFFLIFPSVVLVTLGPATILIYQQMHKLMGL